MTWPGPTTPTALTVARLAGARYHPAGPFDAYFVDCPICGPGAAILWSMDEWRTVLVSCSCPMTPLAWALCAGLSPRLLDELDRETHAKFTDPIPRPRIEQTGEAA